MPYPNQNVQQDPLHEARHNRTRDLAERNERLMLEGLNQISDLYTNAVMVLGRTGSGKSALINLLAGKPLFSRTDEDTTELILDSLDMLPGITIGNNHPAETSIPHAWVYNDDTAYWDCPGFEDNRGIDYEIANAFLIKKLFDLHQTCKILIVVANADLIEPRVTKLLHAVRALDAFFQSDIEKIRSGLMLVVSGVNPDKTAIHIQRTLQRIIDNEEFALTDPQKELFRLIINNPIIMFKKPVLEGSFDISCKDEYLEIIGNLGVINDLQVKSIISPASNVLILQTYNNLLLSINLEIDNLMSSLSLQLQGSIARSRELEDLQELRTAVLGFQEITARFANGVILSNSQLLLEIVPQCMQLNINRQIELPILNLRNILHKTEIFDFLEQFVEPTARVNLGINVAITEYLSSCIRDANSAIQAKELITVQFDLQREAAARAESEARAIESARRTAEKIAGLQKRIQDLTNNPPGNGGGGGGGFCCIL